MQTHSAWFVRGPSGHGGGSERDRALTKDQRLNWNRCRRGGVNVVRCTVVAP